MQNQIFKAIGAIVIAASMLSATGLAAAQSSGVREANFDGVSFRYEASLADGVEPRLVPEAPASADMPYWMAAPRHIEFDFVNFHGSRSRSLPPTIYVFPVRSEYASLTREPNQDFWLQSVQALQQLLSKQPDLRSAVEQLSTAPGSPPTIGLLPPVNAATIVTGKPGYVTFRNGTGTRYLIHITQDVSPPDRDSTLYTFQGLTSDSKYYVVAFFPAFPTNMQPIEPFQGTDVRSYYLHLIDRFDSIGNDAYTPNLDNLDKMIGSLNVHPTKINEIPGMPSTGSNTREVAIIAVLMLATLMLVAGRAICEHRSNKPV